MNDNSVTVVIGTYGNESWKLKAQNALNSVRCQTKQPQYLVHYHGDTLAHARNEGAKVGRSQWLIFLDADDTLDHKYIEAMVTHDDGTTLRQPATLGVYPDGSEDSEAVLIPERPLRVSNYLIIGTMCLREQFMDVGGFDEGLPVLEDWDLWLRISKAGAVIGKRPEAIYRVGVNPNSRNQDHGLHNRYYNIIRGRNA